MFFDRNKHFLPGVHNEHKLSTVQKNGSHGIPDETSFDSLPAVMILGVTVLQYHRGDISMRF